MAKVADSLNMRMALRRLREKAHKRSKISRIVRSREGQQQKLPVHLREEYDLTTMSDDELDELERIVRDLTGEDHDEQSA